MKRLTKSLKPLKCAFIQEWGPYKSETVIAVGLSDAETAAWMRKEKLFKSFIEAFEKAVVEDDPTGELTQAYFWKDPGTGGSVLVIRKAERVPGNDEITWEFYDNLLHELHHATYFILGVGRNMRTEYEALAYMTEWLFREIRRKVAREAVRKPRRKQCSIRKVK